MAETFGSRMICLLSSRLKMRSEEAIATYMVEPYVVAADVYAVAPHTGRGGWTWYTGSAGWMYRLVIESLLGVTVEAETLRVAPCLPDGWTGFKVRYRYKATVYAIAVERFEGVSAGPRPISLTVDGVSQPGDVIALRDDGGEHRVDVSV